MSGSLTAIYVSAAAGSPMETCERATLVADQGIEGDRYFRGVGTFSPEVQDPAHQVTLIESEEVERFNRDNDLDFDASRFRRNLVTRDLRLEDLVGVEFQIGDVVLRGIRLCEPCAYLSSQTDRRLPKAMLHRAGLRAQIVTGGVIRVGASISKV